VPTLVLDAGTGIRDATALLAGRAFHGTIALTHLHWDHVQGLPFFAAGDRPDARVRLLLPAPGADPVGLLARTMSPPHFPIDPDGLDGEWSIEALIEGTTLLDGLRLTAAEVPHKGGTTVGLRVEEGRRSVVYVPDHLLVDARPTGAVVELVQGADLLVHDAQFSSDEREVALRFGHSTIDAAAALAKRCGVGELVLFHHAPARTDDQVEALVDHVRAANPGTRISAARQGEERDLGATGARAATVA
jgi:ribonuclease BN (tRNA processing enzyme)